MSFYLSGQVYNLYKHILHKIQVKKKMKIFWSISVIYFQREIHNVKCNNSPSRSEKQEQNTVKTLISRNLLSKYSYCIQGVNVMFSCLQARIKAKPLIRTYQPRNGYINKRFQPPPPVTAQLPTEVVTSSAPQPQFTATQPFTLMPNVSQYLNSQQVSI